MDSQRTMHYSTLSSESKKALHSGNLTKMLMQLKNLKRLFHQGTASNKGALHRHVIAMKRGMTLHVSKRWTKGMFHSSDCNGFSPDPRDYMESAIFQDMTETVSSHSHGTIHDNKPSFLNERETLCSRKMTARKALVLNTRIKNTNEDSLKETIYKHYYHKLTKLTKMRASPLNSAFMDRAKTRSGGFSPEYDIQSYEEKFRNLMYKLKIKWKPRDYIQRTFGFSSLFCRLCTNIMDCIADCVSAKGHRLESMDRLDNLFKILHRFKKSSPTFRRNHVYRGGGPKKKLKKDVSEIVGCGKRDTIGKQQLSVPVVDSLSQVLKLQFKQEYGLLNVARLHKAASRASGPVTQILKRFDLNPVPSGKHAVQIHFCRNHYVTSEQNSNGIVVYDSLQTDNDFKTDLYPQLRYTYKMLNQYSTPPKDLIQYTTPQQQKDSSSCGIFAILRAFFILSNKSYTFNPDIGRSYLTSVLEGNLFTNFDTFTSNYIINNYMQDKKKQTKAASTSTVNPHNPPSATTRKREIPVQSINFDTFSSNDSINNYMQDQQRLQVKKMEMSSSMPQMKSDNPPTSAIRKRGRPVKYSPEEKKQRDKDNKLKYYHKSKVTRLRKKPSKEMIDASKSAIGEGAKHCAVSSKIPKTIDKGGRPSKYSPEERKLKNREKSLRHYHKRKKSLTVEQNEKHKNWHKEHKQLMRLNAKYLDNERMQHAEKRNDVVYRKEERAKDKQWHADRRQDAIYRQEEQAKDKQWHADRRQDATYRQEEQAKDKQWHTNKRKDATYRQEEHAKNKQWLANKRKDATYRQEEQAKDKQWHANKRKDAIYRKGEQAKDKQWHEERRKDDAYREEERVKEREWHRVMRSDPSKKKEENLAKYKRIYGKNEEDAITKYLAAIQTGPNVVCTCCLQLWFPDNCRILEKLTFPNPEKVNECRTGTLFDGKEWLCSTCTRHLKENRIPPISYANGVKFNKIPDELKLVQMEERCIALRQPFFQIRELPSGGQKSIKGNVVNVPMDVTKTINQLPRNLNETETIGIKFKKKVSYKKCDYCENIRPQVVIKAARYLIANSELYKAYNVKINESWEETVANNTDEPLKILVADTESKDKVTTENAQMINTQDKKTNTCPTIPEYDLTLSDDDVMSMPPNHLGSAENMSDCACTSTDKLSNDGTGPSIIEIDLTISDDEDGCEKNQTLVTIKYEKQTTGQVQMSDVDKISTANVNDQNQSTASTESDEDTFSEVDPMETFSGNMDTMLDSTVMMPSRWYQDDSQNVCTQSYNGNGKTGDNISLPGVNCPQDDSNLASENVITDADALVIAPGEGQHPISLFNDPDAEYLAFPSIYCGQRRPIDDESIRKTRKKPSKADIFKWELRAQDRRVATCIPDIFFKLKTLQAEAVENVVGISVRKVKGKMQPTAGELKTPEGRDKLRNLNEGVNMYRKMRNTPPYYGGKKKNLLAAIRQCGMPALFFTQSCADTRWPELLKVLGSLIDKKDYTDREIEKMDYVDRNRLVAADPVTVVRYFENKCHKFQQHIMNLRGSCRQFLRREFQHRGSPHSHEIHWVNDAPIYDPNRPENDKLVIQFIDSWISTEVEVKEEEKKYLKYQIHKHSTSCRKRGEAICRFGIPFFPMNSTVILKPLQDSEIDDEKLKTLKNAYQDLRKTLNEMGEGSDISYEEFLRDIHMSESEYLLTIRSSLNTAKVFYKRKPNALRVNPYMRGMLAVIKANHDVQYPLNIYAVVCYVADYLLKSQKGLSATLEQACMDVMEGDMRLKQQIRHIGYKLLSTIETSAPEACYYIMQIPFTRFSVEVVFIPTSPPEERTYVLKSEEELSELPADSRDVLKSNIIASYAKRPRQLQFWCLADFVSELTVQYKKNGTKDSQNDDSINAFDYNEHDEDIISGECPGDLTVQEDIFPLETKSATFKKRRNPRVIRFVNYNRAHDPENYYREKLLLYMPWRKEELLKGDHELYADAFDDNVTEIRENMRKYEKFAEEVREAEEMMEAVENDENHDDIAPNTAQAEGDDESVGPSDCPEYAFFRPPKHSEGGETLEEVLYNAGVAGATDSNIETMAGFMDEDTYLGMVRSLNEKQFQIYTHILQHISREDSKPLQLFITGGAGVGKSMVLRCVYQGLLRLLAKKEGQNPEAPRIAIAGPTGKAAYLVGGNTIHSLLKILPSRGNQYIPLADEHKDSIRLKFKFLNTIIIDEVSMVGNNMLSFIHQRLCEIKECDKLFGGLNVIFFGDLFQLKPVFDGWIFEELQLPDKDDDNKKPNPGDKKKKPKRKKKLTSAAALAPNIWKENFTCFELTQVMRQKDDQLFCDILNRMREGNHTEDDIKVIKQNCELGPKEPDELLNVPHFYFSNPERNIHNQKVLLAKEGQTVCVNAIDICTQTTLPKKERERIEANVKKSKNLYQTGNLETELQLKVGLPYDMTINVDTEDGLCNGAALILRGMLYLDKQANIPSVLLVEAEDDHIGRKARNRWNYFIPPAIRQEHPGWIPIMSAHSQYMYLLRHPIKREQFPLSLAAGKTFHKSQGSSLRQAVMAFPEMKVEHIHYVGLSRVTEMSGVKILHGQFHEEKIHVHDGVKAEMSRLRSQAKLNLCFKPLSEIVSTCNLLVVSFNSQSLHKHIENVKADWNIKAAMVIGICETRIKQGEDVSKYDMADFEFHHIEQLLQSIQRPYHGVALYVKKAFPSRHMFQMCTNEFECLARNVFIPSTQSHVQVIMCYKKPSASNELLFKALQEIVILANSSQPVIIMGDFNINKQKHGNLIAKMSRILQCKQVIKDVTTKANTCIDLVFTNMNTYTHGSIFTAVSHHHLTYASFDNTETILKYN